MNKKIIALAVAAGLAAPMAANAAVTVYGKINTGVVSYDNDAPATPATSVPNDGVGIFDESSRLGVKGSEDVGGGLKAYFKMEGTVDMDGSGAFNFNRDTYVGIQGGFGKVQVGRYNTAYKNTTGKMDLFADRWGDITGSGTHGRANTRENNMLGWSNSFGNVKVAVDVNFSEQKDNTATPNRDEGAMGFAAGVNFKPINSLEIALAYAVCGGDCANDQEGDKAAKVGAQFGTGPHTVNFIYELFQDNVATVNPDINVMTLQYGMKMGKNTFALSYTMADPDGNTNDTTQASIGVMHKLSKQTEVYVVYSAIDNDAGANAVGRFGAVGGTAFSTAAGGDLNGVGGFDPSGLAIGIQHNF